MADSYWNYVDALAYALALNSPDGTQRFSADPSKWHAAVYNLYTSYKDTLPQVFAHIFFEIKQGKPPYSPQVEHFLHVQAQARLMSAPNPAYVVLEMSPKQKAAIRRLNETRLSGQRDILQELGRKLTYETQYHE